MKYERIKYLDYEKYFLIYKRLISNRFTYLSYADFLNGTLPAKIRQIRILIVLHFEL